MSSSTTNTIEDHHQDSHESFVSDNCITSHIKITTIVHSQRTYPENQKLKLMFACCGKNRPFIVSNESFMKRYERECPKEKLIVLHEIPTWLIYAFSIHPIKNCLIAPRDAAVRAIRDGLQCISDGQIYFKEVPFLVIVVAHWIAEVMNLTICFDLDEILRKHEGEDEDTNEKIILDNFVLDAPAVGMQSRHDRPKKYEVIEATCRLVLSLNDAMMYEAKVKVEEWERKIRERTGPNTANYGCVCV